MAFAARLANCQQNCESFFADYPDGYLITLVREPVSWFASARVHQPEEYGHIEKAIDLWCISAKASLRNYKRFGKEKVMIIKFEELLENPEIVMGNIANFLGISVEPTLLNPTFNGISIKADSSFEVNSHGILQDPKKRSNLVNQAEKNYIEQKTKNLYSMFEGFSILQK